MPDEVIRTLSASVRLAAGGTVTVKRGQPMPEGAADGEAERLRNADALGEPFEYPKPEDVPEDEAALIAQVEADRIAAVKADHENPVTEPTAGADAPSEGADDADGAGEPENDAGAAQETPEDLDTFVAMSSPEDVVAAANGDPERAAALLEAEKAVREGDPRPEVVEGLSAIGG